MLIGISAKIGCGKTTFADMLVERLGNAQRVAFGDLIKTEAAEFFGFPVECAHCQTGKARAVEFDAGLAAKLGMDSGPMTIRECLQWYGTEYRRAEDPDYWLKAMALTLDETEAEFVIIDDVRFQDEAELVHKLDGLLIRLAPYPGWMPGPHAMHASETALDGYGGFNLTLEPQYGRLHLMAEDVAEIIKKRAEGVAA